MTTNDAPATHSPEATRALAETIRDFLQDDEEGEYDAYDKVTVHGKSMKIRVDSDDLEYWVIVEPIP